MSVVVRGGNYGWNVKVYRGDDVPQLNGRYVFGDFSRTPGARDGWVFIARPHGKAPWHMQEVSFPRRGGRPGEYLLGFGQDVSGEVSVLTSETAGPTGSSGKVYRLVRPGNG